MEHPQKLWIMIAGPYSQGASDTTTRQQNLDFLNETALQVYRMGHIPVIGVNLVLPMIRVAGDKYYESLMMPVCKELALRCDAILRVGGASAGADEEVLVFRERGLAVYYSLEDIPLP